MSANGIANGRIEVVDLDLTRRQRQVVAAARRVAIRATGRTPSTREIAEEIGEGDAAGINRVGVLINHMRRKGTWPPRDLAPFDGPEPVLPASAPPTPVDDELQALRHAATAIGLLDGAARERVLRYLVDRFGTPAP